MDWERRGLWAGHRFDVVPNIVEEFEASWIDATVEVVRDAKAWGLDNNVSPP